MHVAAAFALLGIGGFVYFALVGAAAAAWLLPWRWRPLAPAAAPLLGWAVVTAVAYPLNAILPARPVLLALASVSLLALARQGALRARPSRGHGHGSRRAWHTRRVPIPSQPWWRPHAWTPYAPLGIGALSYVLGAAPYVQAGTLSAVIADSDVEHYADVVMALLHYPIGWTLDAHQGLDATPIGLGSHYAHAALSAIGGVDAYSTAVPSLLLLLALAPASVYVFARVCLGAGPGAALLASALFALSGTPFAIAAFGWRQQAAAVAALPIGLAGAAVALRSGDRRSLLCGGVLAALGACSLYLASAPVVGGAAVVYVLWLTLRPLLRRRVAYRRTRTPRAGSAGALAHPMQRLLALGAVVAGAAFFSHLSALGYLLGRSSFGGLRPDDLAGRSTHVTTFAGAAAALGVGPFDLFGAASTLGGDTLSQWRPPGGDLGTAAMGAAAMFLSLLGLARGVRRPAYLGCVVLVIAGFELYLRVARPFAYGEFKLLTTTWFLVPALAALGALGAVGAVALAKETRGALVGRETGHLARLPALPVLGRIGALAALALFASGVLATRAHVEAFARLPWGGALPEREVEAARRVARAAPRGAAVWVSNALAPDAAVEWPGLTTEHRAGFPSREAGATYLASRWRGVVTALLAFDGRAPYGAVQRNSTELRLPIDPAQADYVLLDKSEDPRLFGLLEEDVVSAAGRLRLFRQARRATLGWGALPSPESTGTSMLRLLPDGTLEGGAARAGAGTTSTSRDLPAAVLPVGETSPGRRAGATIPLAPAAAPAAPHAGNQAVIGPHRVWLGLFADGEREVSVTWDAAGSGSRRLALFPGLSWYSPPASAAPREVRIEQADGAGAGRVQLVAAFTARAAAETEAFERSEAGATAPLLVARLGAQTGDATSPQAGGLSLHLASANLTRDLVTTTSRVARNGTLWTGTDAASDEIPLDPLAHVWAAPLRAPAPGAGGAGDSWYWLSIGAPALPALHQPVIVRTRRDGTTSSVAPGAHSLPLLGRPAAGTPPRDGVLVKGASDRLYYVERGRLRWVPSLETLARRNIQAALIALPDVELWRLPVGLPLD